MKKIPTIFKRNPDNMRELLDEPHPDCQWVFDGEGVATRKYDGTCCMVRDGALFKRREVRNGQTIPPNFDLVEYDKLTGKSFGWVPVRYLDKEDKYYVQAFHVRADWPDGTYELVGPKVQGNPEKYGANALVRHSDAEVFESVPRNMEGLKLWLNGRDIEGVVFHHPDGRMAKIKKRDFGLKRKP